MFSLKKVCSALVLLGTMASTSVFAAVGVVKTAEGGVLFIKRANGTTSAAAKGASLEPGDVITTGGRVEASLEMIDGQTVLLKPGSVFRIDDYKFDKNAPAEGVSMTSLLKGGLPIVSGSIGKARPENYRLATPTAVIGIRGTDYSAVWCNQDCPGQADGMHIFVYHGAIAVSNDASSVEL